MLQNSFKIVLFFSCVGLIGLFLIPKLPVKLAPRRDMPQLIISFGMSNMSSRVVEMEVTSKLEGMLSRIKGIEKVTSESGNGNGLVTARLNKHADIDFVRFEVANLIRQVYPSLPEGVSYPNVNARQSDENAARPFLSYTLHAPFSSNEIQDYAESRIKKELSQLKGIDGISIYGASDFEWVVEYDYKQMQSLGLEVEDLRHAIQQQNHTMFLGMGNEDAHQRLRLVLTHGNSGKPFDPTRIYIKNKEGKLLRLDSFVTVKREAAQSYHYYRINGLNSVYLTLTAKGEVNQLKLAKAVKARLLEMEPSFPEGFEMHLAYDTTEYIHDQLKVLMERSLLTLFLLMALILLIYRKRRYVWMIVCSMLGCLSVSVVVYYLVGLEMHLYSLMGLTISLNLLLDNIIVMADQMHRHRDRQAVLAIVASSLTSIAALAMIFFMDEQVRLNLQDFALVIAINLGTSMLVVLWLVPALMDRFHLFTEQENPTVKRPRRRFRRFRAHFNRLYERYIRFANRKRAYVLLAGLLLFGLPVHLLPTRIETEKTVSPAALYNATLGSDFYQEHVRSIVEWTLGGTLRLFANEVATGSYWKENEETSVMVTLTMPNGSTLEQTDYLIRQMEQELNAYPEIKQFQTNVSTQRASIDVLFTKEYQFGSFPYMIKNELIGKSVQLGGGSWGVYGLGDGYSNMIREEAGSSQIRLLGYNYDELYSIAEQVKDSLLQYIRVQEVTIDSKFSYYKDNYQEFVFDLKKDRLAENNLSPNPLFSDINSLFLNQSYLGSWNGPDGEERIVLNSLQSKQYDVWHFKQEQGLAGDRHYRISGIADVLQTQAPQIIARENQQYVLCLQYDYIGSYQQTTRVLDKTVKTFSALLPMGYQIQKENHNGWNAKKQNKQYLLLLIIAGIIYFITGILFNSLRQPLAILLIVPISFVGLFLTFFVFKLNFDQGGFAAFVLLSGITVNAGIYVVNQYNRIQKSQPQSPLRAYLKAWNMRIVPVFLTLFTTIMGFVPFLIGEREGFWFPLAAGSIGGLIFSFFGLLFFLPALMQLKTDLPRQ